MHYQFEAYTSFNVQSKFTKNRLLKSDYVTEHARAKLENNFPKINSIGVLLIRNDNHVQI